MPSAPSKDLQRVPNPHPDRDYDVDHVVPEFTCICPMTGQPDFATIRIRYVPDQWLVELKSLKLYMWAYRDEGAFHEDVTNRILADLVRVLTPRRMEVVGDWNVRGGIKTVVTVRYEAPGRHGGKASRRARAKADTGPPGARTVSGSRPGGVARTRRRTLPGRSP
jgi:7-cyano-7-deazaguanine reductase